MFWHFFLFRAAIQAISTYLEAFQKIADAATNSKGTCIHLLLAFIPLLIFDDPSRELFFIRCTFDRSCLNLFSSPKDFSITISRKCFDIEKAKRRTLKPKSERCSTCYAIYLWLCNLLLSTLVFIKLFSVCAIDFSSPFPTSWSSNTNRKGTKFACAKTSFMWTEHRNFCVDKQLSVSLKQKSSVLIGGFRWQGQNASSLEHANKEEMTKALSSEVHLSPLFKSRDVSFHRNRQCKHFF